jgi:hypothetical protein
MSQPLALLGVLGEREGKTQQVERVGAAMRALLLFFVLARAIHTDTAGGSLLTLRRLRSGSR